MFLVLATDVAFGVENDDVVVVFFVVLFADTVDVLIENMWVIVAFAMVLGVVGIGVCFVEIDVDDQKLNNCVEGKCRLWSNLGIYSNNRILDFAVTTKLLVVIDNNNFGFGEMTWLMLN